MSKLIDHFPLANPRRTQVVAMEHIEKAVAAGCTDIVIEAPTGFGKAAVGAAMCYWGASWPEQQCGDKLTQKGGYYLTAQKLLQTQIIEDVANNFSTKDFGSLKSSAEYSCDAHENCQVGMLTRTKTSPPCPFCPYQEAKKVFVASKMSLTNYAFFLTEKQYVNELQPRNVLVMDEAHGLEKNLLKFAEVVISDRMLHEMGIRSFKVPCCDDKQEFAEWLDVHYKPVLEDAAKTAKILADSHGGPSMAQRIGALQNQLQKLDICSKALRSRPQDWVFWVEGSEDEGNIAYCKPLYAAPYMDSIKRGGLVRVYMSAYPGTKDVFCRSLGLDPDSVAWIKFKSSFPKENRPIIVSGVGSMSRKNLAETTPRMLTAIERILTAYPDKKGVIHVHTYELGKKVSDYLRGTPHANRILFAEKADERDGLLNLHKISDTGTVMISPSMTEGYDFKDELARFQVLAKVPYAYLGDKQVEAKQQLDPEWYAQQAVTTTVQAVGRGCRSTEDHCVNYLLDSDFDLLLDRNSNLFPGWFKEAIIRK